LSVEELALAASRPTQYRAMPTAMELDPSPDLLAFVEAAAEVQSEYRDRIAAFGSPVIPAMQAWVEDGPSPGFAVAVIEAVGAFGRSARAVAVLRAFGERRATIAPRWPAVGTPPTVRTGHSSVRDGMGRIGVPWRRARRNGARRKSGLEGTDRNDGDPIVAHVSVAAARDHCEHLDRMKVRCRAGSHDIPGACPRWSNR